MKRLYDEHEGQTTNLGDELVLQDKPEFQSKMAFVSDFEVWNELRRPENTLQHHQIQSDSTPSQMDSEKKPRPNWKEGLEFLQEYGYDLETLSPYTRISIQTDKSLTTLGGRSAPTVMFELLENNRIGRKTAFVSGETSHLSRSISI